MVDSQPGWHTDMTDASLERLWDGQQWTDLTRPKQSTNSSVVAGSQLPPQVNPRSNATRNERRGRGIWIAVAVVAVLVLVVVGGVLNRMRIDQEARDAAERGANLGHTSNSLDTMYNLLCPDGPLTDTTETGANCLNAP